MIAPTRREREGLRLSFKPSRIDLLFVGESPPASGRFFYSANSGLYRAMLQAFRIADPRLNDSNFLTAFQQRGCYLTDLCVEPIDHLEPDRRRTLRKAGEKHLARELKDIHPVTIAPVLRSITKNVENAVSLAGWQGSMLGLPYPGRWSRHQATFIEALVPVLRSMGT